MAWSGGAFSRTNGTYNGSTVWQQDEANAQDIEANRHDTHDQDLADGINACVAKDGSNAMTGPLDMNGQKIKNADDIGINTGSPNIAGWGVSFTINGSSSQNAACELSLAGALTGYLSYSVSGASATAVNLYAYANIPLIFGTNNTARVRIENDGRVAIGGAAVTGVLMALRGTSTDTSGYALASYDSGGNILFWTRNDGLINTGLRSQSPYNLTTASAANLHVTSDGYLARSTSSIKYKRDVSAMSRALESIKKLRPVVFRSKRKTRGDIDGDRLFGGLIAEEVDAAGLSEYVEYDKDGKPDAVMYSHMVALAVAAIKELLGRVEALEAAGGR